MSAPNTHPRLSVVILNHYQTNHITSLINSIAIPPSAEVIIVVDEVNADQDEIDRLNALHRAAVSRGVRMVRAAEDRLALTGGSRNAGAAAALGDFVWFIDGDDDIVPDALVRVIESINANPNQGIFLLDYIIELKGERVNVNFNEQKSSARLKLWDAGIMAWFKVIRRASIARFREDMSEDNDWSVRQIVQLIRDGYADYATVHGGPCYVYKSLAPGTFTSSLARVTEAGSSELAARVAMRDQDAAHAFAAVMRMIASLVDLAPEIGSNKSLPREFIDSHEFVIRWWLDKLAVVAKGRQKW